MSNPKVSIIIPAYNNAEYLGQTIQSVLDQTCPDFEVVVVDDASPDPIHEVIKRFEDSRIKYVTHEKNRGLSAARNTGIKVSTGEVIALLDGDDLFHPKKLETHLDFLHKHPDVGVTYNSRFELNHSAETIRDLWRPPLTCTLQDLIFGFPFSPSDMVIRRNWLFQVSLFDENYTYVGEDLDINCRLALAGCRFASVDRALNYRRYHSGRVIDVLSSVENTIRPLNSIFADPRCPEEVRALREKAIANHHLLWSAIALGQGDTAMGQQYATAAVQRDPSILGGQPSRLVETLIDYSIVDESRDNDQLLRNMVSQLPPEIALSEEESDWAVARGYLLRGARAMFWGRAHEGREHFTRAQFMGAKIDRAFTGRLTSQLSHIRAEFGPRAAEEVLQTLLPHLKSIGNSSEARRLKGHYLINQAFEHHRNGQSAKVFGEVIRAISYDPTYLANRGVLSMLVRSFIHPNGPATRPVGL